MAHGYHRAMTVTERALDTDDSSFRRMDESTAEQWAHIGRFDMASGRRSAELGGTRRERPSGDAEIARRGQRTRSSLADRPRAPSRRQRPRYLGRRNPSQRPARRSVRRRSRRQALRWLAFRWWEPGRTHAPKRSRGKPTVWLQLDSGHDPISEAELLGLFWPGQALRGTKRTKYLQRAREHIEALEQDGELRTRRTRAGLVIMPPEAPKDRR